MNDPKRSITRNRRSELDRWLSGREDDRTVLETIANDLGKSVDDLLAVARGMGFKGSRSAAWRWRAKVTCRRPGMVTNDQSRMLAAVMAMTPMELRQCIEQLPPHLATLSGTASLLA